MSIRRDPILLSYDTWRWLRLLAKSESSPEDGRIMTPDEMADNLLRQVIKERYPQLIEFQKEIDKAEKQIIKTLNDYPNTHNQ
ncbi:MAG TPA: hypothetical protein VFG51_01620 [Candidatus Saccharimonadia bacterium]|nr:hypothetical protein [Candidatus Saccharimonadia bacterium]